MKVGVIGIGVVGNANKVGFEQLGHEVMVHDIKLGTNINNVLDTEAVFVCVPTTNNKCTTQHATNAQIHYFLVDIL